MKHRCRDFISINNIRFEGFILKPKGIEKAETDSELLISPYLLNSRRKFVNDYIPRKKKRHRFKIFVKLKVNSGEPDCLCHQLI